MNSKVSGVLISNSSFVNTKNSFSSYRSQSRRLSLITLNKSSDVIIKNNHMSYAGLSEARGKINGLQWKGFSDGIDARGTDNITIVDNEIFYTLTGGIRITGARNLFIKNNKIDWVARNIEYTDSKNGIEPPFSDAISGYHNQHLLVQQGVALTKSLNWKILDNKINFSGNNGIHVSGLGISLIGNTVKNSLRRGIELKLLEVEKQHVLKVSYLIRIIINN